MKSVVVTGVSTGIGWGATKVLIGKGFRVFGSVRKQADADRLKQEFGEAFVPLIFDVTDEKAVKAGAEQVRAALGGEKLAGLVNNAGVAVPGPMLKIAVDDFRQQLEVNLVGVVIATQAFAPLLGSEEGLSGPPGRIVNISSVGGKNATPFVGPYNTSKFGLEGLSESLRRELLLFGIDVIVIAPGAVATAIWGKSQDLDMTPYDGTPYAAPLEKLKAFMTGLNGLPPEAIGEAIWKALTVTSPKVRYTIAPDPMTHFVSANAPRRFIDRMIGKRLGLIPS